MARRGKRESALDLTIKGSAGSFSVEHGEEASTRVEYLQTYVTLTIDGGHDEKLLKQLRPVREVFDVRELDFEQIMQRDIDDARVSTELIPYLLGHSKYGLVKFFPPIIVVVLPKGAGEKPADYYPPVEEADQEEDGDRRRIMRSGSVGSEVFEFRRWLEADKPQDHDAAELRLNTTRSRLVIVDGQHRAMALIALYRNLSSWPEKTLAFKPFYERWSRTFIGAFDLSDVKLPVLFCTFPELDGAEAPLKVHEACRAVFLALNKNAKKVTRARNFLLDDNDVISAFLRRVLTDIKALDERSERSIRIWNVELDASQDKSKLYSPVAVTGVTHLYHLIETLLLGDAPTNRLRIAGVKLGKRKDLALAIKRIRAKDELSRSQLNARRDGCDVETREVLTACFDRWFGKYIVRLLSDFEPYDQSNRASHDLHQKLKESSADAAASIRAMLFDGQGMDRVFESYRGALKTEARSQKDQRGKVEPHLASVQKSFNARAEDLEKRLKEFRKSRLDMLLSGVPKKLARNKSIRDAVDEIFQGTFTTSAFQHALCATFFDVVERTNAERSRGDELSEEQVDALFEEYLAAVNAFFSPSNKTGLKKLLRVMVGEWEEDGDEIEIAPSSTALRRILIGGHLDPKEWPKFRAILVELWRSQDSEAEGVLASIRGGLRQSALDAYTRRRVKTYAHEASIPESKVAEAIHDEIREECAKALSRGLAALGSRVKPETLLAEDEPPPEDPDDEELEDEDEAFDEYADYDEEGEEEEDED